MDTERTRKEIINTVAELPPDMLELLQVVMHGLLS